MSFSLSSLLNPEPAQANTHRSPEQQRRGSFPPFPYAQSPEQHHAIVSAATPAQQQQQYSSYPPATAHEAAQALATLATSDVAPPSQYYNYSAPSRESNEARRSASIDHHHSHNSHSAPIELPPPAPTARQPSSPTLEQYQIASRSPEQRRSSMMSPAQAGITLPPIQNFTPSMQESPRNHSISYQSSHNALPQTQQQSPEIPHTTANIDEKSIVDTHRNPNLPIESPALQKIDKLDVVESAGQMNGASLSPAPVKQELMTASGASSPTQATRPPVQYMEMSGQTPKAIAALKQEHSVSTQSPLRESSVPMQSTEMLAPDSAPSRKRPAPSKTKKGMATTSKKAPPAKKRKVEAKRSETPASRNTSKVPTLKTGSSMGTPANSSPAPSARSYSEEADDEPSGEDGDGDDDGDLYCICRKPDNGTFMIGCDGTCDDWFHGKCVGIEERDKNLIDKYLCPNCTKAGRGRTTWKRMCRRDGCRQPAKVSKSKGDKESSKYCSEECGVMYFREMIARTRNREDTVKSRSGRRKGASHRADVEDDLGAKGGALAAGEVKSLMNVTKTAEDFKKLGDGVLSPPATPDGKEGSTTKESEFTETENAALAAIHEQKDVTRRRHQVLKDRMRFVTMTKHAASRTATEKELKPKEYCGYDPRLEWTEEQFAAWRESKAGKTAFELDTLLVENSGGAKDGMADGNGHGGDGEDEGDPVDDESVYAQIAVCDRKKCARHLEWSKLAVDDLRFEMSDNSDRMRGLEREEVEIRARAARRGKLGGDGEGEGSVEVHGLDIGPSSVRAGGEGGEGTDVEMGGVGVESRQQVATAVMQVVDAKGETEIGELRPLVASTATAPEATMAA
ncbi:COMPASS (complex proteins associated with Set1p) component [Friedmanniomyces endolithicus]|uniref:COMPASS (Complex proteins associated with Set1p) component n=1 Tax=Friedmanniomyces endolithicus TaxID=329885 RepID=A0A4U0UJR1_9PEZI|nr:COMPASS (complex proteins associated with Set1p) component [Friedmanniomyces endolithicus]KAK0312891.1 COMPASS (complex proteins associated with Set1p) component [Friedmanniomyces endolithicus]KAK0320445.1 COMPASS (complex proteins associated with Set1p) component [Friedmanniomyces endolithicus]KAK0828994.1 COMPASS (complex proteins associated with Set1p) component [Friedmanniomyces endolithicus]KAK0929821.1 COMPASS (complex proteins associated with Set1p) component [Friedmanniomyces endolit